MDPIDVRVDTTLALGLRCVEYRLPSADGLRGSGYTLALGLRYGMIGVAAAHHLMITASDNEEQAVLAMVEIWRSMVEEHVRWDVAHRLPIPTSVGIAELIGKISAAPLRSYFPLYRRLCPLSYALELVGSTMTADNKPMVVEGWAWYRRKAALKVFVAALHESKEFALHFYERRQADLDEVPEIVLIGE